MPARLALILLLLIPSLPGWFCSAICAGRMSRDAAAFACVAEESCCALGPSSCCDAPEEERSDCAQLCAQFTLPPARLEPTTAPPLFAPAAALPERWPAIVQRQAPPVGAAPMEKTPRARGPDRARLCVWTI